MALCQRYLAHWIFPSKVNTQAKRKYSLTLDNFSLSSQQLFLSYIFDPCKCPDVHLRGNLAQFWPNKHSSPTFCWIFLNSLTRHSMADAIPFLAFQVINPFESNASTKPKKNTFYTHWWKQWSLTLSVCLGFGNIWRVNIKDCVIQSWPSDRKKNKILSVT